MNFRGARIGLVSALASVTLATALFASPVDPRRPAPVTGRDAPFADPARAVDANANADAGARGPASAAFRTLRPKWEQRLPLGGPIASLGPDRLVVASRTGVHVIDSGGHELVRASIEPAAPDALTLLGDGRVLAQAGAQVHGLCLPISGCRQPYTTPLPSAASSNLPALPIAGGGALVAAGTQLVALDGDGRIWGTTDLGGTISALYPGTAAGYAGAALVIVDEKGGSRVRTFHPNDTARPTRAVAELDGIVTASAVSGGALYVSLSATTLARIDPSLGTAVPLVQVPSGIYALSAYASPHASGGATGVAALVGTSLGYSLLLATSHGTRHVPVEVLPNGDGGAPPTGIGYATIVSDSKGFVAFMTPSGALSMLTPDGTILRFAERPCGTERLPRPPVLAALPGIGLVLGCPSGRTIAFVSE